MVLSDSFEANVRACALEFLSISQSKRDIRQTGLADARRSYFGGRVINKLQKKRGTLILTSRTCSFRVWHRVALKENNGGKLPRGRLHYFETGSLLVGLEPDV